MILDVYRAEQVRAWRVSRARPLRMIDIPPSKAVLRSRASTFDGGHTSDWLQTLETERRETWRAVRDVDTGHTIHIVSDRAPLDKNLVADIDLTLRILRFLTNGPPMLVYAWDQDWKRVLPTNAIPGRNHINGGWAIPGVRNVYIYRREEFHKVLIHECIHALKLDIPNNTTEPVRQSLISELGGRQLWAHLGECYTELFAEWLWTVVQQPLHNPSFSQHIKIVTKRWNAQLRCSRGQAVEVWARIRNLPANRGEDSNVFAYYILKMVLMTHVNYVLWSTASATNSVDHWLDWWHALRPELDKSVDENTHRVAGDISVPVPIPVSVPIPMGMTCGVGNKY